MKPRVLMTTPTYRIVAASNGDIRLECRDGIDAMGVQRWRSVDDSATTASTIAWAVGLALERRAKRRKVKKNG